MARGGTVKDATMTQMQELGSAWIFERAIKDNKGWQRWEHFKRDKKTFDKIKKIWWDVGKVRWDDDLDDEWLKNFYKQQKVLLRKIGRPAFTKFNRDGGFMDWVTKYVSTEFDITPKDNWNPADIWLIQREKHWKDKIKAAFDQRKDPTSSIESELAKFNSIFRALFRTKQIMGISLKKVGSGPATYKEVNVSGKFFTNLKATHMTLESAKCELGTVKITDEKARAAVARGKKNPRTGLTGKKDGDPNQPTGIGKAGAATLKQDTILVIKDPGLAGKPGQTYKVQIKANNSTGFSNLKWEPTIEGHSTARLGKATVKLVLDLMKVYDIMKTYEPDANQFPDDKTGFRAVQDDYRKIIDEMMAQKFVDFGVNDTTTALINIAEAFDIYRGQPWVAQSKLQQLRFLYSLMTIKNKPAGKNSNDFCTSLIFTAEKAGKRYGPYGKIY